MPPKSPKPRRVLAHAPPEAFVGRAEQLRELTSLASPRAGRQGLVLLAAPRSGSSELLRQTFDELFRQRGGATPVYFAFSREDAAVTAAARRFLHTFLTQAVAHRMDDAALVSAAPTLRALLELAAPSDYEWVERLIQNFERAADEGDERALVRLCFGAPRQAAARARAPLASSRSAVRRARRAARQRRGSGSPGRRSAKSSPRRPLRRRR